MAAVPESAAKWTILVYMNAANDLAAFAQGDLDEMERVAQNPKVRIVVQWKTPRNASPLPFKGTGRFLIQPNDAKGFGSSLVQRLPDTTDMGSWSTLRSFIGWGKQRYPAERYAVIVWNHGNGWRERIPEAVSYDDDLGTKISTWDLAKAFPFRVDLLAFDASLMQQMEVAYELRNSAKVIVGSEESPPGAGYPYHRALARFRDFPSAPTASLAKAFVDAMLAEPDYRLEKITQSVLDAAQIGTLASKLNLLAQQVHALRNVMGPTLAKARASAQPYSDNGLRQYRDLIGVLDVLAVDSPRSDIRGLAADAREQARRTILSNGRNSRSPKSNGLSIEFANAGLFAPAAANYRRLGFARDTAWDEMLAAQK